MPSVCGSNSLSAKPTPAYIRRIERWVRYTGAIGRALLFIGIFPPAWLLGTLLLAISKILDNMELGHNVMHGQYDWMNEKRFSGKQFEWDIVGTSDNWRKTTITSTTLHQCQRHG